MANAAADQALVDQLAEAFSVDTTKVTINVADDRIKFDSAQADGVTPNDLVHTFVIKTKKETLITAIVAALQTTGRP